MKERAEGVAGMLLCDCLPSRPLPFDTLVLHTLLCSVLPLPWVGLRSVLLWGVDSAVALPLLLRCKSSQLEPEPPGAEEVMWPQTLTVVWYGEAGPGEEWCWTRLGIGAPAGNGSMHSCLNSEPWFEQVVQRDVEQVGEGQLTSQAHQGAI